MTIAAALLLTAVGASAQKDFGGIARFDTTVHDFGKVDTRDGAVSCSFTVTNISEEPLNIFAVTTTCSCTTSTWTRESIAPGAEGKIEVTFTNDEGPYPFDKTLNVYLSDMEKPIVLHVKGVSYNGKKKK
mgnify:CR=1 FL=1